MKRHIYNAQTVADALLDIARGDLLTRELIDVYPRDIEALLLYSLELPVEYRSDLTIYSAERYLCALRRIPYSVPDGPDRKLLGLLCVGGDTNLILVKAGLPKHIRNYVLAHEIAHFLVDIFIARNLWLKRLPERSDEIIKVFSWRDYDDWVDFEAYLKGLPQRPRSIVSRGKQQTPETEEKELEADLVARELLLPWDIAESIYRSMPNQAQFVTYTHENFGLPLRVAHFYYYDIQRYLTRPKNFFETLFASEGNSPVDKT